MYFEDQCQWTKYFVYLKSFVFIESIRLIKTCAKASAKYWNGNLEKVFQNSRKKAQVYN